MIGIVWLGIAVAMAASAIAGYSQGVSIERGRQELVITNMINKHLETDARLKNALKNEQQRSIDRIAVIDQQHQEAIQHAQQDLDKLRADVRTGAAKLRKHFTCPPVSAIHSPEAAASTRIGDATEAAGLSQQDADVLVSIAKEADDVVRQLQACQAIVRSDRVSH